MLQLKTKELSLEVYSDYSILIDQVEQTVKNNVFTDRVEFNRVSDKKIVLYSEHGEYRGVDLAHSFINYYKEDIKITSKPLDTLSYTIIITFVTALRYKK